MKIVVQIPNHLWRLEMVDIQEKSKLQEIPITEEVEEPIIIMVALIDFKSGIIIGILLDNNLNLDQELKNHKIHIKFQIKNQKIMMILKIVLNNNFPYQLDISLNNRQQLEDNILDLHWIMMMNPKFK
jgi:hypothetical protein